MKYILTIILYFGLFFDVSYAMTYDEYTKLLSESPEYAAADKEMLSAVNKLTATLSESQKKDFNAAHSEWLKEGRDNEVTMLESYGVGRIDAYVKTTKKYTATILQKISGSDNSTVISEKKNSDRFINTEAEGSGTSRNEAINEAWNEAIRKTAGMYISSNTSAVDEKILEQINIYSRGRVDAYTILSESNNNGIWKIKITARIDKNILQESENPDPRKRLPGNSWQDTINEAKKIEQNEESDVSYDEIIAHPEKYLDYSFEIKEKDGKIYGLHKFIVNMNKYNKIVKKALKEKLKEKSIREARKSFSKEMFKTNRETEKLIKENNYVDNGTTPFEFTGNFGKVTSQPLKFPTFPGLTVGLYESIANYTEYDYELYLDMHYVVAPVYYIKCYINVEITGETLSFMTDEFKVTLFNNGHDFWGPYVNFGIAERGIVIGQELGIDSGLLKNTDNIRKGFTMTPFLKP